LGQVYLGQTDLLAREQFLDPGGYHDITFVKAAADDDRVALIPVHGDRLQLHRVVFSDEPDGRFTILLE
jgi:hypothetical protein